MAQSQQRRRNRWWGVIVASTTTLALWRVRRMWGMLFVTGLGMVAAVMLVCAVPLYSQVALTAGLRDVLTATPDSATLTAQVNIAALSTASVAQIEDILNQSVEGAGLDTYTNGAPQLVLQTDGLPVVKPKLTNSSDTLAIAAYTMPDAAHHVHIVKGRLPKTQSEDIEIALTPETATGFGVTVGSTLIIPFSISSGYRLTQMQHQDYMVNLQLHVVGLYTENAVNDTFWHGNDTNLAAIPVPPGPPALQGTALASNDRLLSLFDQLGTTNNPAYSPQLTYLSLYYGLNTAHFASSQLNDLISSLSAWQDSINGANSSSLFVGSIQPPYVNDVVLRGDALSTPSHESSLEQYRSRTSVLQIPNGLVLFQILALVLFFVAMMAELLVERQAETIAILRSRGANRWQIFGSFMTQTIVLGLIALLAGPLLALFVVRLLAQRTLSAQELSALDVLWHNTIGVLYDLRGYILTTVLLTIAAMGFSIYRTVGLDVLAIRRETARSTAKPLWQRLNLDIVAIVIAITGYFVSYYLSSLQVLDASTNALIVSPLTLVTPLFLVVAGILLVLRLFPLLLRIGAIMAARRPGASAMLAFGQIARSPRQPVRMTLLLALASAFTIFTLVFTSSQEQRVLDLASYQAGADFSGSISYDTPLSIREQTTEFVHTTRGVLAATFGYAGSATIRQGSNEYQFEIRGVDADTFAQTAQWTGANSTQSLDSLMGLLRVHRSDSAIGHVLPALVDAAIWQQLNLSVGKRFTLYTGGTNGLRTNTITYVALGEIQHIPTINSAGLLFDYQSGNMLYRQLTGQLLPRNYLWVKTSDDATAIAHVRTALTSVQPLITQLADRRAIIKGLSTDPLYLDLLGVLALGAMTALLLALVGNLLASWLSARSRVTNFAVLRALGTSTQQVARVLTWEQGITYIASLLLGIVFGALLSITAIPSLVFSSVPTSGLNGVNTSDSFYALQHVLPVQITVPFTLGVALVVLVLICAIALWIMIRVVTQPALGQMLRLNED